MDLDRGSEPAAELVAADVIATWGSRALLSTLVMVEMFRKKLLTKSNTMKTPGVGEFIKVMDRKGIEQGRG